MEELLQKNNFFLYAHPGEVNRDFFYRAEITGKHTNNLTYNR